jgi:hypothetical protein
VKVTPDCYDCLERLVYQASGLATEDTELRKRAEDEGIRVLNDNFSSEKLSIIIAAKVQKKIREVTGNPDPYRRMKEKEIALAQNLCHEIQYSDDLKGCLEFAALGNSLDFFRNVEAIKEDMRKSVQLVVDDSLIFRKKLERVDKVLYLADNAGEAYFDLPLIEKMGKFATVIYVVKESAIQNDATIEDVKQAGLKIKKVMSTGEATPGIDFSLASAAFKREFESAGLIFAKGMGYYETLSELPCSGKFFFCLMTKCRPVARSLGVPLGSYVAKAY